MAVLIHIAKRWNINETQHPQAIFTLILAAARLASPGIASAADVTYTIQTSPMMVDENLILVAAHAQADVTLDILVDTTGGDYAALIADLPESKGADTANDYDPCIVNYAMARSYDFIDMLYDLANIQGRRLHEDYLVRRHPDHRGQPDQVHQGLPALRPFPTGEGGQEAAFREELAKYIDPSKMELLDKVETMPVMATRFQCAGSIGANSIENLLDMAYWMAFAYPEYANPVYVATYRYKNFYHITDNSSLQTIIAANFADASIPDGYGYTTDISGYSDSAVEAISSRA